LTSFSVIDGGFCLVLTMKLSCLAHTTLFSLALNQIIGCVKYCYCFCLKCVIKDWVQTVLSGSLFLNTCNSLGYSLSIWQFCLGRVESLFSV